MKKITILFIAAIATMTLAACRFSFETDAASGYETEASVRSHMQERAFDAALMTTVDDTQRVVYLRLGSDTVSYASIYCGKDSAGLYGESQLFATLIMDRAVASPTVTLTPVDDTTYSIDSVTTLLLANPRRGDMDELQRFASWCLYCSREALNDESMHAADGLAEAEEALEEASRVLAEYDTVIVSPGCKAQKGFGRLQQRAKELGFGNIEVHHRAGHRGCSFSCSHAFGSSDDCYTRMTELSKLAGSEGLAYSVKHKDHGAITYKCSFHANN